jgi:response regulator RpfG family c-di-GMP phosphodiesterase
MQLDIFSWGLSDTQASQRRKFSMTNIVFLAGAAGTDVARYEPQRAGRTSTDGEIDLVIKTRQQTETRTVLIVEDDPSVLRSLERLVRAGGFEVRAFESPKALLQSEIPQTGTCMIIDVNLPEMSGVELCEVLAAAGHALPAILITGMPDDPKTNRLLRRARAVAILHKPFAAALLFDVLSCVFLPSQVEPD